MSTNMKPLYKQLHFKKLKVVINNLRILHNVNIKHAIMNLTLHYTSKRFSGLLAHMHIHIGIEIIV